MLEQRSINLKVRVKWFQLEATLRHKLRRKSNCECSGLRWNGSKTQMDKKKHVCCWTPPSAGCTPLSSSTHWHTHTHMQQEIIVVMMTQFSLLTDSHQAAQAWPHLQRTNYRQHRWMHTSETHWGYKSGFVLWTHWSRLMYFKKKKK